MWPSFGEGFQHLAHLGAAATGQMLPHAGTHAVVEVTVLPSVYDTGTSYPLKWLLLPDRHLILQGRGPCWPMQGILQRSLSWGVCPQTSPSYKGGGVTLLLAPQNTLLSVGCSLKQAQHRSLLFSSTACSGTSAPGDQVIPQA